MTKRRKLMPPPPPLTLLASMLSNLMVCCPNPRLAFDFFTFLYGIRLPCSFMQLRLPREASTSVSRAKPLHLLSSPKFYIHTTFLTSSALETCTPTSNFPFIYFFAFTLPMGLFFMIIFFYQLRQLHVVPADCEIQEMFDSFSPASIPSLSSSCQTFISEGQLLCSDPSFVRFLSFPFTHDSHTQEPKVFVSIVFLSRIFICCGFHHIFTRLFAYRRTSFKACKEFYIAFMSPRFHYYFYYYYYYL